MVSKEIGTGTASKVFDGPSGTYDLKLGYVDELDGQGTVRLLVGGREVGSWRLDADDNRIKAGIVEDVRIESGQTVSIVGESHDGERARIDYLEITGTADGAPSEPEPLPETGAAIGQAGNVTVGQSSAGKWHSVSFDAPIENAVVVMGPVSFNGSDPVVTRVRNVSETGFEFQLDEWDYLDGSHIAETVSWMAVEAGHHVLSDGREIHAGSGSIAGQTWIDFGGSFAEKPLVFAQYGSASGPTMADRVSSVSTSGFSAALSEQEANGSLASAGNLAGSRCRRAARPRAAALPAAPAGRYRRRRRTSISGRRSATTSSSSPTCRRATGRIASALRLSGKRTAAPRSSSRRRARPTPSGSTPTRTWPTLPSTRGSSTPTSS